MWCWVINQLNCLPILRIYWSSWPSSNNCIIRLALWVIWLQVVMALSKSSMEKPIMEHLHLCPPSCLYTVGRACLNCWSGSSSARDLDLLDEFVTSQVRVAVLTEELLKLFQDLAPAISWTPCEPFRGFGMLHSSIMGKHQSSIL